MRNVPVLLLFLAAFHPALPIFAQSGPGASSDRIWGRVVVVTGEAYEGFIRWDLNEVAWADVLDGSKDLRAVEFKDWWELTHPDEVRRTRVIEVAGYRITWDDDDLDLPSSAESGIRFGHIRRLIAGDRVWIELQSGLTVEMEGPGTDLGSDQRGVVVEGLDGGTRELDWEDLETVVLGEAPPGAEARAERLFGTVTDDTGHTYTGYVAWGRDEALTTDTLTGRDATGKQAIPFGRIVTVTRTPQGARVTLSDGGELSLFGEDDVSSGGGGVLISDPALGSVEVPWRDFREVRFHAPESSTPYGAFADAHRLRGTVETADGDELMGWILWDADEAYSWEFLDGERDGVRFDVEFGKIAAMERFRRRTVGMTLGPEGAEAGTSRQDGVRVTLLDGRTLELDNSNDVDDGNKGVFVLVDGSGQSPDDEEAEWIRVRWEDFQSVRFDHGGER